MSHQVWDSLAWMSQVPCETSVGTLRPSDGPDIAAKALDPEVGNLGSQMAVNCVFMGEDTQTIVLPACEYPLYRG